VIQRPRAAARCGAGRNVADELTHEQPRRRVHNALFRYLSLGHVFVANMTGNVVSSASRWPVLARSQLWPAFSLCWPSLSVRRWAGGGPRAERCTAVHCWLPPRRFRRAWFWPLPSLQAPPGLQVRLRALMLIGLLALAMGGQKAVVRRLAVPDLTTTVLTLTVTGLVADTTSQSVRGRRLISVLAMLGGALAGGVFGALDRRRCAALVGGSTAGRPSTGACLASGRPQSQAWR